MRFLAGLIIGAALAASAVYFPQTREWIFDPGIVLQQNTMQTNPEVTLFEEPVPISSPTNQMRLLPLATPETEIDPSLLILPDVFSSTSGTQSPDENSDSLTTAIDSSFQPVWIPFRSEVSARGFASKLHHQLSYEFSVIKIGPGKYEVGFLYESETERSKILDAVTSLTGSRLTGSNLTGSDVTSRVGPFRGVATSDTRGVVQR